MTRRLLARWLLATILTLLSDLFWLGVLNAKIAQNQIRDVQNKEVNVKKFPALLASMLVSLGTTVFCLKDEAWTPGGQAFAALYGLVVFGVYDLSNYAVFDDYKLTFALVDVVYGIFLCSIVYFSVSSTI